MAISRFAIYDSKKSRFIKRQETSRILSNLGSKISLSKTPWLCDNLYKMNKTGNTFLLAGDRFMP